jgi:hypothetical protein
VHYLLGHARENQGSFKLACNGTPIELKVDYGGKYEPVRIRKGYGRTKGKELESKIKSMSNDEAEMIQSFAESSVLEIVETMDFLEPTFKSFIPSTGEDLDKLARVLIGTVVLQKRLNEICVEFESVGDDDLASVCDAGYSSMKEDGTQDRLRDLLLFLCALFPRGDDQMRAYVLSKSLYKNTLVTILGLGSTHELESLNGEKLRECIEQLTKQS